jgi:hypothetical protein
VHFISHVTARPRLLSPLASLALLALATVGCGSSSPATPRSEKDAGGALDATALDAGGALDVTALDAGGALDATALRADAAAGGDLAANDADASDTRGPGASDAASGSDAVETPVGPGGGAAWMPKGGMRVGTNLWGLEWGIWDDVFLPAVDFSSTTHPYRPGFVNEVSHYGVIRFMDFQQINSSMEQHWTDRTQKHYPASQQMRLAYEWMIELCNQTHTDMWINIPHLADHDYVQQLATLIFTTLDPSLKVYVEWSNETWNNSFSQTQYAYDRGNALALDTDKWAAAYKYQVYAAVRVFAQFQQVFGASAARLVKVIGGELDNSWVTQQHLAALQDATINPDGIKVDAYAIAPYFGEGVDWKGPEPMAQLAQTIPPVITQVQHQAELVARSGLYLVTYEGGQHIRDYADAFNARPEMYQIYTDYLNALAPHLKLLVHYVHNGGWNEESAWGAEESVGQPLSKSHKLRALFEWIGGP